jgi:hypothetical protein
MYEVSFFPCSSSASVLSAILTMRADWRTIGSRSTKSSVSSTMLNRPFLLAT